LAAVDGGRGRAGAAGEASGDAGRDGSQVERNTHAISPEE